MPENRHHQLLRLEIIDLLALPGCVGVEDFQILRVVDRFIVHAQIVCNRLAIVGAKEAVELFEVRVCDLADIFADLDLGNHIAVFVFHRRKLINAAEDRLGSCGNQPLADAKLVNLRAL